MDHIEIGPKNATFFSFNNSLHSFRPSQTNARKFSGTILVFYFFHLSRLYWLNEDFPMLPLLTPLECCWLKKFPCLVWLSKRQSWSLFVKFPIVFDLGIVDVDLRGLKVRFICCWNKRLPICCCVWLDFRCCCCCCCCNCCWITRWLNDKIFELSSSCCCCCSCCCVTSSICCSIFLISLRICSRWKLDWLYSFRRILSMSEFLIWFNDLSDKCLVKDVGECDDDDAEEKEKLWLWLSLLPVMGRHVALLSGELVAFVVWLNDDEGTKLEAASFRREENDDELRLKWSDWLCENDLLDWASKDSKENN